MKVWFARCALIVSVPLLAAAVGTEASVGGGIEKAAHARHKVGLGAVLVTQDGGQVFGFDIDRNGDDGVLASAQTVGPNGETRVSVETFDQNTGTITASFARATGTRNSYSVDAIVAPDVGLVTHYIVPKGTIYAKRRYDLMNPVTAEQFTGAWTPPIDDIDVLGVAETQNAATSALFSIELKNQDRPDLIVSDVAANSFSKIVHLDPALFGGADGPILGRFTFANQAVFALSPDGGAVGGVPPVNVLVDLSTGITKQFKGINGGPFGAGSVNGLAVDPKTGIAATTTELNAQVEFYDLARGGGIAVQLPCTGSGSQGNSGAGIAVDAIHQLFLVTDQFYCNGNEGSAIVIYDEHGELIETLTGFNFVIGEPAPALNPSKRMGWALSHTTNQLQQFFY